MLLERGGWRGLEGHLPVVEDALAFEALDLQQVQQAVVILHEVAHELTQVPKLLDL